MMVENFILRLSRLFFPLRRVFYLVPIVLLAVCSRQLYYPLNTHWGDEVFELACLIISLLGVFIRFVASGSSLRISKKGKGLRRSLFETRGVFSLWQHPHIVGDIVVVFGLSLLTQDLILILFVFLFSLLFYMPIAYARERFLEDRSAGRYRLYAEKTGLLIPSISRWKGFNWKRFSFKAAIYKEGGVLLFVIAIFVGAEFFREAVIQGCLKYDPIWLTLIVMGFLVWEIFHLRGLPTEVPSNASAWVD